MSIKKRIMIISIVLFLSLLSLNTVIFLGAYNRNIIEQQKIIASLEIDKCIGEISNNISRLEAISYDWGSWDDTVKFVNGEFPNYGSEYFYDNYFEKMNLDVLAIADRNGDFLLTKVKKSVELQDTQLKEEFSKFLLQENLIEKVAAKEAFSISKMLFLKEGFLELNAKSITNNLGSAPPQGIIFTANFVFNNSGWIGNNYTITNIPGDIDIRGFEKKGTTWYKFENLGDLKFFIPSELFSGQKIMVERNYPDERMFRNQLVANLVAISLFVCFAAGISYFVFRKYFLKPLQKTMDFMADVNLNNIENRRLEINGVNEFAKLAEYINGAVGRIETDSTIIKDLNQRYVQALEAADAGSFSLSVTDMVFRMDEKLAKLIGYREKDLQIKLEKLRKYFDPEDVEKLIREAKYHGISILNNDVVLGLASQDGEKRYLQFKSDLNRNREDDDVFDVTGIALEYTEEFIRAKQLEYMSFHDILTGLYNRSFFENTIDKLELNQKFPYGVIIGDMNGLKMVNDTFGHEQGDTLLKAMAAIFRTSCRAVDMSFRWGGDEFAVVLPGADSALVEKIVEKINKSVEEFSGSIIPPSISLGYSIRDIHFESASAAIRSAEEHMYGKKVSQSKEVRQSLIEYFRKHLDKSGIETLNHNTRLMELAVKAGTAVGYSDGKIEEIRDLASLHDIGMVSVNERIIRKAEALEPEELMALRIHTETGFRICKATPELSHISYAVLTHHEHFDGSGYPKGLKSNEIPSIARLFAIIDAFEAMTHERPYRKARSREEAIQEIRDKSGSQFDPQFVEACLSIF